MRILEKISAVIIFASFYIIGIVSYFTGTVPILSLFLLVFTFIALKKDWFTYKSAVVYYLIFALAIVNCSFRIKSYDDLSKFIPSKAVITGTVESIPTTNNPEKTKFYLKVKEGIFDGVVVKDLNARTVVTVYDSVKSTSRINIADTVELTGKLRAPLSSKNPSQFDYSRYLRNHGTFSTFYVSSGGWTIKSKPKNFSGRFLQKLNDTRTRILKYQSKYMKPDNLEVLGGMVFGDDAINPPEHIRKSFINSGLLHILAASGMNVSIIFGIWFFIGTRLRFNYRLTILIGALLVAFYTLMTGMGPSVLRASLMIEFVLLGKLIDRKTDSIALIFLVAFLMLLYNPAMINDVGFQLSFVVTFALMFYCPTILSGIKNKVAEFFAGAVLIPFVAQLWASPIQMFYFNTYATYSVLANFAITIFVMLISFLGFVSSILAMIPVDGFADKVCMVFSYILNPIVSALISISNFFSQLPYSLLGTIHPNIIQMSMYYGALVVLGFVLKDKFQNKKLLHAFILLIFLCVTSFIKIPSKSLDIIVFDVGNADSFLIKTPDDKYIMIDTAHGSYDGVNTSFSQADAIMNKYLKDNGIKGLELLILTHFDADHSGGAIDVMKTVAVKRIFLSSFIEDTKLKDAIFKYLENNKIAFEYAQNNKKVYDGHGVILRTFAPDSTLVRSDNDNSVVTMLSYGNFDMLFMADGGVRSFNKIKDDLNNDEIEILKSGHHGAKDTVTTKMLKAIKPDVAIISTGVNSYGHPHKSTLKTFAKNNVKIYRTDISNALKISTDGKTYKIYKYDTIRRKFVTDIEKYCRE